jgi:predicted TIM-barrel fold metal-dependent hydrolase
MIWGNWPVSDPEGRSTPRSGSPRNTAQFGERVRDKVMYKNALRFYRRDPRP